MALVGRAAREGTHRAGLVGCEPGIRVVFDFGSDYDGNRFRRVARGPERE